MGDGGISERRVLARSEWPERQEAADEISLFASGLFCLDDGGR